MPSIKDNTGASTSRQGATPQNYPNTRSSASREEQRSEDTQPVIVDAAEGQRLEEPQPIHIDPTEEQIVQEQEQQEVVPVPAGINQTGSSSINSLRMAHIMLQHFHDETTHVPSIWWSMFENYVKVLQLTNEAALGAISFHIQGQANTWYHSLNQETKSDMALLKGAFFERFKNHSTNNELYKLAQGNHETGSQYLTRVQNLTSGAQDLSEQVIVGLTINGLRPALKSFVVGREPKTFQQLRVAINLATNVADCKEKNLTTCSHVNSSNNQTVNVQNIDSLCSSLIDKLRTIVKEEVMVVSKKQTNENRGDTNYRQPPRQQYRCYYCGKSSCRRGRQCRAFNSECFKCKKIGHYKEMCPNDRYQTHDKQQHYNSYSQGRTTRRQ